MRKKITLFCMLFLLLFTVSGCDTMFSTPISKILQTPRDYAGKQVTVSGTVTDTFGLVVIHYFTVKDDTGEIPVVTDKPLPKKGQQVKVTGKVEEAFAIGDKQLIVIKEEQAKN